LELEIEEEKLTWRRADEASSQRPPLLRCSLHPAGPQDGGRTSQDAERLPLLVCRCLLGWGLAVARCGAVVD